MKLKDKKMKSKISIDELEELASKGKDVNHHFTTGQKMPPLREVQRVNVDFTQKMLSELDQLAKDLNISRQAVIKSLLMQAIDQHKLALKKRGA